MEKLAPLLFIATLLLLALSLLIGHEVKGASRWIGLGPIRIQPAEIMKLAAILTAPISWPVSKPLLTRQAEVLRLCWQSFCVLAAC